MIGKKDLPTGGYFFNRRMVRALENAGVEVGVLHLGTLPDGARGSTIRTSIHALKTCREFDPGLVVISKSYRYVWTLRLYLGFKPVPVLYLVHHLEWHDRGTEGTLFRRSVVRWLLKGASRIWANSRSTADDLERLGIDPGKTVVVSPGLNKAPEAPPDRSGGTGPATILCAGAVCPRKAQLDVVRACSRLKRKEWRLVLAGSMEACPDYAREVGELVERLELGDRVEIAGHVERGHLRSLYREADILVQPSLWEGFGISVAEGMWWGLPVVASDRGALPELVEDGRNGFLVQPGDVEVLAERIGLLLDSPRRRLRMGRSARSSAENLPDWEQTSARFCRLAFDTAGWESEE